MSGSPGIPRTTTDHGPALDELPEKWRAHTVDRICGDWDIVQLTNGHRFSTDDMVTAWTALQSRRKAVRYLDLGAGIGSVGMMTLWGLPASATATFVEAQRLSHELCFQSIERNGLSGRVQLRCADLRAAEAIPVPEEGTYDLVTGSPPYIPSGHGVASPHPQRAACRIELRGDIFDYCRAAARALAPGGVFCFCHAASDERPEAAVVEAGLRVVSKQDVCFRADRDPTIALYTCAFQGSRRDLAALVVRNNDGSWTRAYQNLRSEMDVD